MLVLVRHGQATANAAGLLLGRSDVPLTEIGQAEVAALAGRLGSVRRLLSSPLRRAVDTAEALGLGLPVEIDDRWVEIDYGEHEGRPLGDVPAEIWQRWRADPEYRPGGGESLADVGRRVRAACEELLVEHDGPARRRGDDVVVVSHVSPIKAAVAWALGTHDGLAWRLHLSTGSVTRIAWEGDGPVVHGFNWVP